MKKLGKKMNTLSNDKKQGWKVMKISCSNNYQELLNEFETTLNRKLTDAEKEIIQLLVRNH